MNTQESPRRSVVRSAALLAVVALLTQLGSVFVNVAPASAADVPTAVPQFSEPHGFKTAPFSLSFTSATAGATIRYTLDGTTPSASVGTVYVSPITVSSTSVVRAIATSASLTPSATVTQTYLFAAQIQNQANVQPGYPTVFAKTDANGPYPADYEMDPEVVNNAKYAGGKVVDALQSIPSVSITTDIANLFDPNTGIYVNPNEKTADWERPISIELIDPNGGAGFTQNAGLRMHGQASRRPENTPKHSFRVYFKKSYGAGKLAYNLFGNNGEVYQPVVNFDQLILRNGGNRSFPYWDKDQRREVDYVNDEFAREAYLDMGHLSPHGTYVHLYLNGLYWGLYDTAERPNEKMLVSYLGGLETDYDVVVADEDLGDIPVADPGTIDAYNELMALVVGDQPIDDALYATIATKVDVTELADYMLLTQYLGKTDWPNHNWNMYRKRVGADTRFKFMTWDNDSGLNKVNENITLFDEVNKPAHLFLRLTTNAQFKQLLTDRTNIAILNNGPLSSTACITRYTKLTNEIDQAVIAESARWGDFSRDVYQKPGTGGKSGPAYLHSRDFTNAEADPGNLVPDNVQKNWTQVRFAKLNEYCPQRGAVLINQYIANGWYNGPSVPVPTTLTTTTTTIATTTTTTTIPATTAPTTTTVPATTTTVPTSTSSVAEGLLVPITPVRIADTRPAPENLNVTPGKISAGNNRVIGVSGVSGLPNKSEISAVVLNVTTVNASGPGFLTVYPATSPVPTSSNINFEKNSVKANQVTVPLGTDGKIRVYSGVSNSDVVVDVTGYYTSAASSLTSANALTDNTQARLLDTRNASNTPTIGSGELRDACPAGAVSGDVASFNVTAVNSASAIFVTAYPSGTARPLASALNTTAKTVTANMVMSPVGANGCVSFYVSGTTDLIVDQLARWTPATGGAGRYMPLDSPTRFYDTRAASGYAPNGITGAGTSWDLVVAGTGGVPSDAKSVLGNLTAVDATSAGYMKVYPAGTTAPTFSNVNFVGAAPVANSFMTGVGSGASYGGASFYHHSGGFFIVDVAGYYTAS